MKDLQAYLIGNFSMEPPLMLTEVEAIKEPGIFALITRSPDGFSAPRFIGETSNLGELLTLRGMSPFWKTLLDHHFWVAIFRTPKEKYTRVDRKIMLRLLVEIAKPIMNR
jgi:hypothetical protein